MQRALAVARCAQAVQATGWAPEVAERILHWRGGRCSPAGTQRGGRAAHRNLVASSAQREGLAAEQAPPLPQLPLCEREPRHDVPLPELLAWREAAQRQVEAVGDSWARQDEGPSAEDLQTELAWLLDDALAAWARHDGEWHAISWQQLERELRQQEMGEAASQHRVRLREPLASLEAVWEQRLRQRVPLQYLTATAFWRDIVLSVGPGVLIPRPETELMVDFVQQAVAAAPQLAAGAWADLGTGSGVLAVAIARALPSVPQVYACDLSPTPLAYAAFNAQRLGVAARVTPVQGSWFEGLEARGVRRLAGVVSNPPYICSSDMTGLQAEVGGHEPHLALHGGEGLGIDCLLPICTGAARVLQPGGFLALETAGGEQALYIAGLLSHMRCSAWHGDGRGGERPAFADVRVSKDLRGVDRFVTASRAADAASSET